MARTDFENLRVYCLSEDLADAIWDMVLQWQSLAQGTVGKQVIRSADSIGANIAEGTGRGTYADNRRCAKIGRGSLNETKHWLRRAFRRKLMSNAQVNQIKDIIDRLAPSLNAYSKSIGKNQKPGSGSK